MNDKLSSAQSQMRQIDAMAAMDSPVHRLHPLCKLLMTILYIAVVVSVPKYQFTMLIAMALYPAAMFALSGLSVGNCLYKLRFVLPLVLAVGIANPFFDKEILLTVGGVGISGGVISMITLMLKGTFALMASFLLIATTKMDALCASLRKIHVPQMLVSLFLLTYRYISVMIGEVSVMSQAYHLRAPNQKGIRFSAWGSFLGQLLLRSSDRAQELYSSMLLRGFDGSFRYAESFGFHVSDAIFAVICIAGFAVLRMNDVSALLGSLFV